MQYLIQTYSKPEVLKALITGISIGVVVGTLLYKICYLLACM